MQTTSGTDTRTWLARPEPSSARRCVVARLLRSAVRGPMTCSGCSAGRSIIVQKLHCDAAEHACVPVGAIPSGSRCSSRCRPVSRVRAQQASARANPSDWLCLCVLSYKATPSTVRGKPPRALMSPVATRAGCVRSRNTTRQPARPRRWLRRRIGRAPPRSSWRPRGLPVRRRSVRWRGTVSGPAREAGSRFRFAGRVRIAERRPEPQRTLLPCRFLEPPQARPRDPGIGRAWWRHGAVIVGRGRARRQRRSRAGLVRQSC